MGGAEKQTIALAERMASAGHVVSFLVLTHAAEEWPVKLPVLRLNRPKTASGLLRGLRLARKFVALFRPDILHSHTYPANIFARLLQLRSHPSRPLLINTIHNVYEGGWQRMLTYRLTSPWVDRVTAVSTAAAERYLRLSAVPSRKMQVLTNGIDLTDFDPNRSRRRSMRQAMSVSNEFIWLAIGRIAPAKDYPNLLHAFIELQKQQPNARLWIAGEGDPSNLPLDQKHQSIAQDQADAPIRFLGLRHDIPDLLDAADAYVLSSAWEGMPLALAEAMAMSKPIVATDVGGVSELLGQSGIVVPAKDSPALTKAMSQIMTSNDFDRKRFGQAARQRIEDHFSIEAKAIEWQALYQHLLASKQVE